MSEQAAFTIEIDGVELDAQPGEMVIQVADRAGMTIPRFCYHEKLSIAANCRMCMVEVEKCPKPLPACATPVTDGMKVRTHSKLALEGQRGSMEFLLINHPLDCPICDQGGECELQDIAMGYGSDVSRFNEGKRVVFDKNIGPLIATEMTRCIHCTRCVRFGDEIAGVRELGGTGRGEHMEIGTYIEKSVDSELSGNMIDVCPVGALTSKPFRFKARAWELIQKPGIAIHDSLGSNIGFHIRRNKILRVVPESNEAINEVWLSDRDRFSYEGIEHPERLSTPLIRTEQGLLAASWEQALSAAIAQLQAVVQAHGGDAIGGLLKANEPLQAMAEFKALLDALGSPHCDHRLRQTDFRTDALGGAPCLGSSITDLEQDQAVLLVGSNLCKEQPLLAHRIRKMVKAGGQLMAINPAAYDMHCKTLHDVCNISNIISILSSLLKVVTEVCDEPADERLAALIDPAAPSDVQRRMAQVLLDAESASILLGGIAHSHPDYALLIALATELARLTGAKLGYLHGESNAVGAHLLGLLPAETGLDAQGMLEQPRRAYLLAGVEPGFDCYDPSLAKQALKAADSVIVFSRYRDPLLEQCASVMFPVTGFGETDGDYINLAGIRQSVTAVVKPAPEVRPLADAAGALRKRLQPDATRDHAVEAILERANQCDLQPMHGIAEDLQVRCSNASGIQRLGEVPLYRCDDLVRHAASLQQTADARDDGVRLHPNTAHRLGMGHDAYVTVQQTGVKMQMPLTLDDRVAEECAILPAGTEASSQLGPAMGTIELSRTLL